MKYSYKKSNKNYIQKHIARSNRTSLINPIIKNLSITLLLLISMLGVSYAADGHLGTNLWTVDEIEATNITATNITTENLTATDTITVNTIKATYIEGSTWTDSQNLGEYSATNGTDSNFTKHYSNGYLLTKPYDVIVCRTIDSGCNIVCTDSDCSDEFQQLNVMGNSVLVKEGTYNLLSQINITNDDIAIYFENNRTILNISFDGHIFANPSVNITNFKLYGANIEGNNYTSSIGLGYLVDGHGTADYITLDNIRFVNSRGNMILCGGGILDSEHWTIKNSYFEKYLGNKNSLYKDFIDLTGKYHKIHDNVFITNIPSVCGVHYEEIITTARCIDCKIEDNRVFGAATGDGAWAMHIPAYSKADNEIYQFRGLEIKNNHIYNGSIRLSSVYGLDDEFNAVEIIGNKIYNNGTCADGDSGINIREISLTGLTIQRNYIEKAYYGIYIDTGNTINNTLISDNTICLSTKDHLRVMDNGVSYNWIVRDNLFDSAGSYLYTLNNNNIENLRFEDNIVKGTISISYSGNTYVNGSFQGREWNNLKSYEIGNDLNVHGKQYIYQSGENKTLLRFKTERDWDFRQGFSGASTELQLHSLYDGKRFSILSLDGSPIAHFEAQNTDANSEVVLLPDGGTITFGGTLDANSNSFTEIGNITMTNDTYYSGNPTHFWKELYATTIYESGTALNSLYCALTGCTMTGDIAMGDNDITDGNNYSATTGTFDNLDSVSGMGIRWGDSQDGGGYDLTNIDDANMTEAYVSGNATVDGLLLDSDEVIWLGDSYMYDNGTALIMGRS